MGSGTRKVGATTATATPTTATTTTATATATTATTTTATAAATGRRHLFVSPHVASNLVQVYDV